MSIPPGHWVKPHPDIRYHSEPPYNGAWVCKKCGGIDECNCLGNMPDPICDCGWPGYACKCEEQKAYLDEGKELGMVLEEIR